MTLYANLDFTKSVLKASQPTGAALTVDDMRLAGYLRQVSDRLDNEFIQIPRWPMFAPWYGTRQYVVTSQQVNSRINTFQFTDNLLALTGDVTRGNTTLVVGTNVELYPLYSQPPYHALRLIGCCPTWYDRCEGCGSAPTQVGIPGIWGFHRDWANAFPVVTTLTATMTSSQSTLAVADLEAPDPYGIVPAISYGSLLQIDDDTDELMEVIGVNVQTKVAAVRRGVNGTTAVEHTDADAGVKVFQVETPVQIAVARQAALQYARLGAFTTVEVQGMTEVRYPNDWLVEIRAMMQGYVYGY